MEITGASKRQDPQLQIEWCNVFYLSSELYIERKQPVQEAVSGSWGEQQ